MDSEGQANTQNNQNVIHSHKKTSNLCRTQCIRFFDISMACLILAPLVVIYWRTTWLIMDLYIYPQHHVTSACVCAATGCLSCLLIVIFQRNFMAFLSECDVLVSRIVWRICMYPMSLSCIAYWRGIWMLADVTATMTVTSFILSHSISFMLLCALKTASTVVFIPGFYINDLYVSLSTPTLAKIPCSNDKYTIIRYILNCLLTVCIVGLLVVLFWRGTWLFWDYITDFDTANSLYTHLLCYGLSCCVCMICFMISRPLESYLINSKSCPLWIKVLIEHTFVYILGCCSVNVWRSVWYVWDLFFLTGSPAKAAFTSHFVSLSLLYIGQGAINIAGIPIGCRTHGASSLEGLYLGSYFTLTEPLHNINTITQTDSKQTNK